MRRSVLVSAFIAVLLGFSCSAQTLSYTLNLDGPVKGGGVSVIYLTFTLITETSRDQAGLQANFQLGQFRRITDTEFVVEGPTPAVMSGTYRLNTIQLRNPLSAIRNYNYPTDYKDDITVKIETSDKHIFPEIKSVGPSR